MNLTYYIGAGASAGALPIVSCGKEDPSVRPYESRCFNKRLSNFFSRMKGELNKLHHNFANYSWPEELGDKPTSEDVHEIGKLWDRCMALGLESERYQSIDTFAKKLWLTRDNDNYQLLKLVICLFIDYEQIGYDTSPKNVQKLQLFGGVDPRYDSYFATFLDRNDNEIKLPSGLNVISWNYDNQWDISFRKFCGSSSIDLDFVKSLNGTAFKYIVDQSEFRWDETMCDAIVKFVNRCIWLLRAHLQSELETGISFAWDDREVNKSTLIQESRAIVESSDLIVFSGYSFPLFNRKVDYSILSGLDDPQFKRIEAMYIHCPENSFNSIKARLESIVGVRQTIKLYSDIESICIPEEYFIPPPFNPDLPSVMLS